jgi:ribosomal protein S18 acetylase RimI-like enzyme
MKINEVKRFNKKTFNAVLRLLPQLAPDAELVSKKRFKKILKSGRTHFFKAELSDKQIVGMLTIVTYDIPSGSKVWIEDVVVDESHRGKGYGKELMLFAIDYAKSIGKKAIELTSRPARIEANKLYHELGFVIRETNLFKLDICQR